MARVVAMGARYPNIITLKQAQQLTIPKDAQEAVVYFDTRDGKTKRYDPSDGCIQIATISTKPSPCRVLFERVAFVTAGAIIASVVWWLAVWYFR